MNLSFAAVYAKELSAQIKKLQQDTKENTESDADLGKYLAQQYTSLVSSIEQAGVRTFQEMRKLNCNDIELFILTNESVFVIDGKEYSVCCPKVGYFSTWDSNGNTHDYPSFDALLNKWVVGEKLFREVAPALINNSLHSSF